MFSVTKQHRLGGFDNGNPLSHSSGSWKSETKVCAALMLSEGWEEDSGPCLSPSFWGFVGNRWCSLACGSITWSLPLPSHDILPVCVSWCQIIFIYKDTSHIGLGCTLMTSFFFFFFKDFFSYFQKKRKGGRQSWRGASMCERNTD